MAYPEDSAVDPATNTIEWFWVSRDSHPRTGVPEPVVDLWYVRPDRYNYADVYADPSLAGAAWRTPSSDETLGLVGHQGRYTIEQCLKWCHTIPDDDRQLLVVGRR